MKTYGGVEFNSALDGDKRSASRPFRFTPKETVLVPPVQEAGWDPKPVWTLQRGEKSLVLIGNRTPESSV
jgi:hypothetical protein